MPCVNDTCSISHTIDGTTGALSLNTNLDPNGCLSCSEPNGLAVNVDPNGCLSCGGSGLALAVAAQQALACGGSGLQLNRHEAVSDTAANVGDCSLPVGVTTDTNALYVLPATTIAQEARPSTRRSIPVAGGITGTPSISYFVDNNTDCDQLVEVHAGEVKVIFEVNDANEYFLTGALLMTLSQPNIGGDTTITERIDYAGDSSAANTELQYSHHIFTHVLLEPGDSLLVDLDMSVGTRSGNIVGASGGGVGGNTGFRSLKNYVVRHPHGVVGADIIAL